MYANSLQTYLAGT